jgi:uncharacterized membrane protein YoaK (UPF0700 family)
VVRYPKSSLAFAISLSALAGFIDARGFLGAGFFVSFMSGNSTRLGLALAHREIYSAISLAAILPTFVCGVALGTAVGHWERLHRPSAVLCLVSFCLLVSATAAHFQLRWLEYGSMVLAMGAENAVFQEEGEVTVGLTYMTGALVKLGQRLAGALLRRSSWSDCLPYSGLWGGMVLGASLGAVSGRSSLWLACIYAAALSFISLRMRHLASPAQ